MEAFAPDMAVPHLELLRRDGEVKVRLQRAGLGWSIEVSFRREVVRRGFGRGPEYSAVEWDCQLLRFGGSSQICELSDALSVVAAVISENGRPNPARGALDTGNGELETAPEARS